MQARFLTALFFVTVFIQTLPGIAQTLFTYGTKQASSKGFIKAFEKNPGTGNRKKAMEEYLPLYINYVLKVQDGYDKKLDTLSTQKAELMQYKLQLADGYISEKSGADALVDEAIERMKTDIQLGHIYIEYINRDTAGAINKANDAYKQLKAGKSWGDVAAQYATDPYSRNNKGIAGWIGPFVIPYRYENIVYNLQKGAYTEPIRASQGIHIFSKRDTRPGIGTVEVAQILLAAYQGMSPADRVQRGRLADSLYNLLQNGAKFESLVSTYSEDRTSKFQQGLLQPFSTGTYDAVFEQAAYALQKPGDYSKPFESSYGWHILKLVSKKSPPAKDDAEARALAHRKIIEDGRAVNGKENYVRKMLPALKYKPGPLTRKELQAFTDSLLKGSDVNDWVKKNAGIFSFSKQTFSVSDWMAFVRVQQTAGKFKPGMSIDQIFDDFVLSKATDYLPAHLDEVDTEFASRFKEFKDANLLFDAMERNVWNKAMTDTVGLKKYFDAHPDKYTWGENVVAISITAVDSAAAFEAYNMLKNSTTSWRHLNQQYNGRLFADSGRFELAYFPAGISSKLKQGNCTAPLENTQDGNFIFVCVLETGKAGIAKTFEEAKGFVVSDYQVVLEEKWIAALKKKYPVKMNEAEWQRILKLP